MQGLWGNACRRIFYALCIADGCPSCHQWRTQEFCSGGGVQQIQLRTEDKELGAVVP